MVNESVYGAKGTWLTLKANSTVKVANFGDNVGTIQKGFQTEKLKRNKPYNNSIVHSSLGNESAISRFKVYKGSTELSSESYNSLMWSLACGTTAFQPVSATSTDNTTNMLTPITNNSIANLNSRVIVDYDYKKIRAVIQVYARQSENGSTITKTLHDYCENYSANYPYITSVYLELYEKIGTTWQKMTTYGYLGLLMHNETKYFSHIHAPSKTFTSGFIGNTICSSYGSGGNTPQILLLGLLSSNLGDFRITENNINIVSGDVSVSTDDRNRGVFHLDYFEGFEEYAMHQCACFGFQFVTDTQYINVDIESETVTEEELENVFIGVLDSNFIGHGDYVNGEKIKGTAQYKLDSANDSPFDPSKETDPNAYHNTSIKPINVDGNTSFTTKYVLNYGQLNSIAEDFYKALNTKPEDLSYSEYSNSLFLTNNAIDTVVSCKYFPFQLPMTGGENVKMGNYTIKVNNEPLVAPITSRKVSVYEFECGSCFGEFGDFRDFEPYTTYELKVPFCGSVRLNASECVGKTITVSLAVDIESGSCTAFIYAGNELVESISGSCGVDIPISAVQQATLDSQIFNASINQRQAKTNAVLSVAKGVVNVGAGAYALSKAKTPRQIGTSSSYLARSITDSAQDISNSMYNAERANYNISHVEIPYKCVGAVSSGVCLSESLLCSLIKETPVMLDDYDPVVYAKTIGYACCKSGKIGSESGMVVCSDVRIANCTLTKTEKDMIVQLCKTGIIV